jgi:hypothetical protein
MYSELFPKEAKEQQDLINRQLVLFEKMNNTPLSELIVEELVTFIEIKHKFQITSYDLDEIEGILNKVKYRNLERNYKEDL